MSRDLHSWVSRYRSAKDTHERQNIIDQFHQWLTEWDELNIGEAETILQALNARGMVTVRSAEDQRAAEESAYEAGRLDEIQRREGGA